MTWWRKILTVALAAVLPLLGAVPASAKPKPFDIAVKTGNATQLITVSAASRYSTTATLRAWEKRGGTWRVVFGPMRAYVGSAGVGPTNEGLSRTPQGTFTLTEAFGAKKNPGTALPYHRTTANDWWVSDTRAASYNTLQRCQASRCPFNTAVSEHLKYIVPYYDFAVVMDYNRAPVVAGAGSAFFLHVTDKRPTAGCVAIGKKKLKKIMRWLDPAAHPRIAVGVRK